MIASSELSAEFLPAREDAGADVLDQTCINLVIGDVTPVSRIGRYELLRKLGEGGMGAVYLARDPDTGASVALKVLSDACLNLPEARSRFEKEARLLKKAENPFLANMLELGTDGSTRFLVMEFVPGGDLRRWLKERPQVEEDTALEIIGDLCRALLPVHAQGMVHRDIKPENILLSEFPASGRPSIKLTDFGLARQIDQSESLKLTRTGALLGTPYYMAPEQFKGTGEFTAATDIYALGITLYELLAGRRPFQASDPILLATAHCFDLPPDLRKFAPHVTEGTMRLVTRMLAKNPAERPRDAAALLEEIAERQRGGLASLDLHPLLPEHNPAQLLEANFEWQLESSAEDLWPLVSNTDRFNRAAGIPPVTYDIVSDDEGNPQKFGHFRLGGVAVRWKEHPFEWIEGRRFSILREFPTGPFVWFLSIVELQPRIQGGTILKHQVRILPRNLAGRLLARLEVGIKGKRNLDRIYRRIDHTLSAHAANRIDPFEQPRAASRLQTRRRQQLLDGLRDAGICDRVVGCLEDLLAHAAPQELARIRPNAVARQHGLDEQEFVTACLQGTRLGLLTMHWELLCPSCRIASDARDTLREIDQHAHCEACQFDFAVDFGTSIELVFRAHPEVRLSDARVYCNGGPGNFPHVAAQIHLAPRERMVVPLALEAGRYVLRGPRLPYTIPLEVNAREGAQSASLRCAPSGREPMAVLRAGSQQLTIDNQFSETQLIRIERLVARTDVLSSADATAHPLFRTLFPHEVLAPGRLVNLAVTTFLVVQLDGLEGVFQENGDAAAWSLLQDYDRSVARSLIARGGTIIREQTGLVLATFPDAAAAIDAARGTAIELHSRLPGREWSLSGALHRGSALVTTDRQQIQYFGAAIQEVLRLAREARPGCFHVSATLQADPAVMDLSGSQLQNDAERDLSSCGSGSVARFSTYLPPLTRV